MSIGYASASGKSRIHTADAHDSSWLTYGAAPQDDFLESRVTANAFNPGMMQTGFANVGRTQAAMMKRAMPHRFGDLAKSSDAYARLVVDDALATTSANYYDRSTTAVPSSDLSYDEDNARELWIKSMRLCGLR